MHEDVVDALAPLGVFHMGAPGTGVGLGTAVRVLESLATNDPSVAWAAMNSSSAASMTKYMGPEARDATLAKAPRFLGVGLPPTGRADVAGDAYRVSGRWPVVSGSAHADLFALNCVIHTDGDPTGLAFAMVPTAQVEIHETWNDVIAVRGSGSHAVSVDAVHIEPDAIADMFAAESEVAPWDGLGSFGPQSLAIAAIATGIARGAVTGAIDQAKDRVSVASGRAWIDSPSVQNAIAAADIAVYTTRAGLFDFVDDVELETTNGAEAGVLTRARAHSFADHCMRMARTTVSDLFATGSVDAIRQGHVLEQSLRDVHGFSVQWERYRHYQYDAGRVLLGGDPPDATF